MQNAKSKSPDLHLTSSCLHHLIINPIQSTPSPSSHLLHQHNPSPQTPAFSLSQSKIDGRNPGPILLIFFVLPTGPPSLPTSSVPATQTLTAAT